MDWTMAVNAVAGIGVLVLGMDRAFRFMQTRRNNSNGNGIHSRLERMENKLDKALQAHDQRIRDVESQMAVLKDRSNRSAS